MATPPEAPKNCTCWHLIEGPKSRESGGRCIQGGSFACRSDINSIEGSSDDVFCKSCSSNILAASIARHRAALDQLRSIRNILAIKVTSKTMENDERQSRYEVNYAKIDLARERLESMRQNLLVNSQHFHLLNNEEKKGATISNQLPNVGGGLRDALASGTRQIQTTRFCFALRVFEMHRIDVGEEYSHLMSNKESTNRDSSNASGIGKIGGLPLPHAGPALYGVLPPGMLASSLRLVASLTNLLARCLGVVLPHPILGCSKECARCGKVYNYGVDVVETTVDHDTDSLCSSCERDDVQTASEYDELHQPTSEVHKTQSTGSSLLQKIPSKSSVLSFVGSSARKAVALATGSTASSDNVAKKQSPTPSDITAVKPKNQTLSMQSKTPAAASISRRINYASFAVLIENHESGAAEYILNPPRWKDDNKNATNEHQHCSSGNILMYTTREEFHVAEEKFSTGLQLLQNDVIALCFRAGVDASSLWPAEIRDKSQWATGKKLLALQMGKSYSQDSARVQAHAQQVTHYVTTNHPEKDGIMGDPQVIDLPFRCVEGEVETNFFYSPVEMPKLKGQKHSHQQFAIFINFKVQSAEDYKEEFSSKAKEEFLGTFQESDDDEFGTMDE
ncbi:hypothetical protein ACHAXN_012865 [Cyclotella atomus]